MEGNKAITIEGRRIKMDGLQKHVENLTWLAQEE